MRRYKEARREGKICSNEDGIAYLRETGELYDLIIENGFVVVDAGCPRCEKLSEWYDCKTCEGKLRGRTIRQMSIKAYAQMRRKRHYDRKRKLGRKND